MRTRPASRLRRILSVAAAASIGLIPAVLVATPAHAGAGDITVSADLEQAEGDTFVFEVRRTGGVGLQPVTLTYDTIAGALPAADVSNGTTSDLTRLTGETVFAASTRDVVKQFKVVTKDDALNEDAENFVLEFRDKVSTNVVTEAYGIIDDNDDKPTYSLAATDPALEGIGNVTVTASIDKVSGRDVTIPYWTTAGSATDGDDYTGVDSQTPADLVIPAGQTSKTATIAIDDDTLDEEDSETFSVVGGNAPNATKGTTTTQVVNISDNDQPPVVSITGPGNTAEGTPMDFGVNLSEPSGRDVKVRVTSSDGSAKAGADYDLYDQELTITHGQTSVNAQVTTTTDTLDEVNPETFTMTLSATPTNATRSTPNGSATGNISDDDNAPTATLAPANVAEGTSGTVNKEFTVTLDAASGQPVKIGYTVSAGTATEGTDYSAVPAGELTFAPGATQQKIVVPIIGDNVDEGSGETLFINLSNSDGTVSGASDLGARTITIDDDDNAPVLQTITAITRDEDAAGTAGFVVKLSNPSAQPVSLEVSTTDVTTDSDPGTFRDFDPIAAATPVTISAYQSQVTVPVTILADDIYEGDETATFTAALAGDETDATGGPENATLTLVNDDDAPTVGLSASTAAEGGSVTLTATVTGVAQADIPVNVALTGGAGDPADPGDFTPTSLTPTILGGASATPTVNLGQIDFADDDIDENNETVLATLTDPAQQVTIATVSATQTITDNDASPTFAVGDYPFAEGDGEVDIPIDQVFDQNVSATERTMTVHYATQDGTAKEDDDYDGVSGTLTFTGGGPTSKPVKVDIEDDLIFEKDETFTVKLSSPTPAGAVISQDTGTMTVQDDDSGRKPTFTVSAPATAVSETTTTAYVTINVSPKTTQDIDFVVSAEADLATSGQAGPGGSDYTVGTTAKVLAGTTSVTVPVTIANDTVYEGPETATIKVALAGGETDADTNFPDKTTTFSIADNDNVPTMSLNAVGNRESQSVDVTGTVLGVAQRAVPLTVTATGSLNGAGTDAAEPGDFSGAGLNVTQIPPGDQTGAPVSLGSITLADDQIDENPETVKVDLTVNNVAATPAYFLIADDTMDMTPTIGIADVGGAEGTPNAQLTASLDFSAPGNDATSTEKTLGAHWATADGSAKAAEPDYTTSSGDVTFTKPDTSKSIDVPISDDNLYELPEDFFVNLSAPTGTTISSASAKVTITDNDGSNKPTFSVTGSNTFTEGTAPGKVEYTVTMSPKNTQDVAFTVEVIGGTATQDDFATPTGTLTIPANATTGKIQLTVKNDVVYEPNETVLLKVALDPGEADADGPAVQKTLSITDDDPKPTVTLVAESGAEGTDLVVAARVHGVSQTNTTFGLTLNGDATGGNSAAEASDFVDNHEAATIPAGTQDGSLVTFRTFRLNNDTIDEPVETIRVVATNADGDVPSDPQYYRINDDANDVPPSVTVGDLTVDEGDGTVSVPVTLAYPAGSETTETEQVVTVNLATGDDTAFSPSDYAPAAGPISFQPTDTVKAFDVTIENDARNEDDETFEVTATSVVPGNTPIAKSTGTVTITLNDQDVDRPGFSVAPVSQLEGATAGTATFTVTLDDVAADDVTFTVGTADDTASDAGTGPGSNDYNPPSSSSVTVTQGVTTGQFSVPVNGDAVFEDDEAVDVTVTLAEGERDAVGGPAATTLTILNDDARPTVRLSNASGYEGDQILLNGTVSGSTQDTTDAEVTFSGGDSAEVDDYSLDGVTLEGAIPAGAVTGTPVSLGVLELSDDTVDEPIETVQALSGTRTTTYRILDDPDDLPPTVSIGDATIGEDEDSIDLTISLNFSGDTTYTDYNVVVPWYTTNGNARAGYDYDASEGNALILAGTDSAEINVPINDDALYEGDQTFYVGLDTPQPSVVKNSDDTADVTIVEDDDPSAPTLIAPVSRPGQGLVTMTGTAGESATVVLWGAPGSLASGKFAVVATTQANLLGAYSFSRTLTNGYRFYTVANGEQSAIRTVQLGQLPTIRAAVGAKGVVALTVTGNPKAATQAVQFQQLVGGAWRTVAVNRLTTAGTAVATIRDLRTGTRYSFRAVIPSTPSLGILEGTTAAVTAIPR